MSIVIFLLTVVILFLLFIYLMKKDNENMFQKYYSTMMSELERKSRNQFYIDSSFDVSLISASPYRLVKQKFTVTPISIKHEQECPKIKYREYHLEDYLKKNK